MSQDGNNLPILLGFKEIKRELWKKAFRDLFPEWKDQIGKFLANPGCECNRPLLISILESKDRLESYFKRPIKVAMSLPPRGGQVRVINTDIHRLEEELRNLPPGMKYIALARYQDQITAVVQTVS